MKFNFKNPLVIGGIAIAAASVITIIVILIVSAVKPPKKPTESKPVITPSSSEEIVSSKPDTSSTVSKDNGKKLIISSPEQTSITVTEPQITFSGTCDPQEPLTVNGNKVEYTKEGLFTFSATLNVGKNKFSFLHKGETKTYTVTYRYVIISSYEPSSSQSYGSGSTFIVTVNARKGSTVKASFNGQTITLNSKDDSAANEFTAFTGSFKLPDNKVRDTSLGVITYTATYDGKTESFSSGNITCKKNDIIVDYDPNATPAGGKYINVGSGYIAEVVEYNAETFDGNDKNSASLDWSRPTNNYLPQGTVDYCSVNYTYYHKENVKNQYVTLRSGQRVYYNRIDKPYTDVKPVVKQYIGTLPDHNEISVAGINVAERHTTISLNTLWKAPFYFELREQSYVNPSTQNYNVENVTFNYIDITLCYTTMFGENGDFTGELELPDNPIFKSATVLKNQSDYTLRLFLKKQGAFYGWDSYYNSNGQLCFEFLNPLQTEETDQNEYGINLNGAKILIDVGHGGKDIGAPGFDSKNNNEAVRNLYLANILKTELEKTGAKVILTRSGNTTSSTDDKIKYLKQIKPDYCIAIHHNSYESSRPSGFSSHYFNAFSKKAAEYVKLRSGNISVYKSTSLSWHVYFMGRVTNCPVVLTENGFMSNIDDYDNIINPDINLQKAKAITHAIADYFRSIRITP